MQKWTHRWNPSHLTNDSNHSKNSMIWKSRHMLEQDFFYNSTPVVQISRDLLPRLRMFQHNIKVEKSNLRLEGSEPAFGTENCSWLVLVDILWTCVVLKMFVDILFHILVDIKVHFLAFLQYFRTVFQARIWKAAPMIRPPCFGCWMGGDCHGPFVMQHKHERRIPESLIIRLSHHAWIRSIPCPRSFDSNIPKNMMRR